eukprot:scaffold2349_cov407-Prasinococcus_capsulatus_cf.AAC.19
MRPCWPRLGHPAESVVPAHLSSSSAPGRPGMPGAAPSWKLRGCRAAPCRVRPARWLAASGRVRGNPRVGGARRPAPSQSHVGDMRGRHLCARCCGPRRCAVIYVPGRPWLAGMKTPGHRVRLGQKGRRTFGRFVLYEQADDMQHM